MHDCTLCAEFQTMANSVALPCCHQRIHYRCLVHSVHACGDGCPFCTRDLLPFLTNPVVATHHNLSLTFSAPHRILWSTPSMDRTCHLSPTSGLYVASEQVGLPTSHLSTTAGWNGPRCNPQVKGGPQSGRHNGFAALVGAPTSMDDIPTIMVSCPTCSSAPGVDQLEGLFVSVSLVAEKSRHFLMTHHLLPTIPLLLPSHRPLHLRHAIGSPTVPSADSARCTGGDQPLPRRREVARNPGFSAL